MENISTLRAKIEAQGFCGLDDDSLLQINYPLRLAPAICLAWTLTGTALASPNREYLHPVCMTVHTYFTVW